MGTAGDGNATALSSLANAGFAAEGMAAAGSRSRVQRRCAECEDQYFHANASPRPACPACDPPGIQRLARDVEVGPRDDAFEREAHHTAQVMSAPAPSAGTGASTPIHPRPRPEAPNTSLPASLGVSGIGAPLDARARAYFEPRFDRDLGDVRVHSGRDAQASAHSLNARAYTLGRDVVLGEGAPSLASGAGRSLLAHELTHVVQQTGAAVAPRVQRAPPLDFASAPATGNTVRWPGAPPPTITVGPLVNLSGGTLWSGGPERVTAFLGPGSTLRGLATSLLPLYNSVATQAAAPSADELARAIAIYDAHVFLRAGTPLLQVGVAVPLPIEVNSATEWTLNPNTVRTWAGQFNATDAPVLDRVPAALAVQSPADVDRQVDDFLARSTDPLARGVALWASVDDNPWATQAFAARVFQRLGPADSFEMVMQMLLAVTGNQLRRLAALAPSRPFVQRLGIVLSNPPAGLSAARDRERQENFTRLTGVFRDPVPGWNFTPADFARLQGSGRDLTIASDSTWFPSVLQTNLLNTLRFLLAPRTSPPPTEGINATDFFHGHLVIRRDPATAAATDAAHARQEAFEANLTAAQTQVFGRRVTFGGGYPMTQANLGAYTTAVAGLSPSLGTTLQANAQVPGAAVMYHTFEFNQPSDLKAVGQRLNPENPRRHYVTPVSTNTPVQYTPPAGGSYENEYRQAGNFVFLVDNQGAVHVRPMTSATGFTTLELSTITGTTYPEPIQFE